MVKAKTDSPTSIWMCLCIATQCQTQYAIIIQLLGYARWVLVTLVNVWLLIVHSISKTVLVYIASTRLY